MKLSTAFYTHFAKSGFIAPLNNYLVKEDLSIEEEKLVSKINDRIAKSISLIVQIDKIEKADKEQKSTVSPDLILTGLHSDLFTTLTSIYLSAKELFAMNSIGNDDEVEFWQDMYELSKDDLIALGKPYFEEVLFINNSMVHPKYRLRAYGNLGSEVFFQCYDLHNNDILKMPTLSNGAGLVRTKYFAMLTLVFLQCYLSTLSKYLCFDEFGEEFKPETQTYPIMSGMKAFHEIANEWMEMVD